MQVQKIGQWKILEIKETEEWGDITKITLEERKEKVK
jgi:hypothetical protein